jgi:hypothetical protein
MTMLTISGLVSSMHRDQSFKLHQRMVNGQCANGCHLSPLELVCLLVQVRELERAEAVIDKQERTIARVSGQWMGMPVCGWRKRPDGPVAGSVGLNRGMLLGSSS